MSTYPCPKGHQSTESDFCCQCGSRITGSLNKPLSEVLSTTASGPIQTCPDCTTEHEGGSGSFCEICGYNFITKLSGALPVAPPPPPVHTGVQTGVQTTAPTGPLQAIVAIDPSLQGPDSPVPPSLAPITIPLDKPTLLIGRTSQARAVFPEIALDFDDAVSTRHAILTMVGNNTWSLRDIGSSNGTQVNGRDIAPMQDVVVNGGDRITLGHWTTITLV